MQSRSMTINSQKNRAILKALLFIYFLISNAFAYNRDDYGGWAKNIHTGCNTRQEILLTQYIELHEVVKRCQIKGLWVDFYTGKVLNKWEDIDIDHILPVSYYDTHCRKEDAEYKELKAFYNDKDNLVITSKAENRKKGAKTKEEYAKMISNAEYRKEYEARYDLIYERYCSNKKGVSKLTPKQL